MNKRRDVLQVLFFNYLFCTILSFADLIFNGSGSALSIKGVASWFPFAAGLGFLYLLNFSLTEKTVRMSGAAVTSAATKLSLVLPFFYTLLLSGERPDFRSLVGLVFCIAAIVLCSANSGKADRSAYGPVVWLLPVSVFAGTGLTDILTQWLNQELVPAASSASMILVVFGAAAFSALLFLVLRGRFRLDIKTIIPGFLLGLPNFISYKSILAALSAFGHKGNVVFPLANLGVIVCTSLLTALYFKDKLSRLNIAGLVLAILSLSLFFRMP